MLSDYNNPIDSGMATGGGGGFDGETMQHLRTAGKWGKFISIVGMAFLGLFLLMIVFGGGIGMFGLLMGGAASELGVGGGVGLTVIMIIYGAIIAFTFYIYYQLYLFSTNAIKVVDDNNYAAARESFKSLATVFKIVGVLMAIYLAFMALGIVGMLVFGATAAF